ncbi:hypothetical protein CMI38_04240 [Candidatus Pacearchaeota archaeon]|jgi:hypothetical protein|nr:hypothetical protein [Candidatus Pacearchaeota archaeon]|tara:strand:+ start:1560 stop:2000 length:441 start_codon:yes stop_codon:yes gene_type:complete
MKLPHKFDHYINKGIVRKITPDKSRSEFLTHEAKISKKGLDERIKIMGINELNTNSIIKDCYDIIMQTIRAKLLRIGLSSSGNYAHEAEVAYLKELNFSDNEISFLNELRYIRNSIVYYGKILDSEYAEKVYDFLNKIIPQLKQNQ